jgi:hypothetical protein
VNSKAFETRFRALAFSATPARSRRGLLAAMTSGLLVVMPLVRGREDAAAKNKKKKGKSKKKRRASTQVPPPFNAFGCLDVGQPCRGDSTLCCSGRCDPGTATCVAHNAGICFADADLCTIGVQVKCNPSNPQCTCLKTTGNAGFCGDLTQIDKSCRLCSTDTDCEAEFGAGAACVVLGGICTEICGATGRTACVRPCA